jgi:acetylornithine/succinyldiaminopimelate/putrescine aminotransferase
MSAFTPGSHASTFGGTPVITAAALAAMKYMERENIVQHGRAVGEYFREKLLAFKDRHEVVEDVRGMGLLLGIKLTISGAPIVSACLEKGFLINCVQDKILRFVPPLIITKKEIDSLMDCLDEIFKGL